MRFGFLWINNFTVIYVLVWNSFLQVQFFIPMQTNTTLYTVYLKQWNGLVCYHTLKTHEPAVFVHFKIHVVSTFYFLAKWFWVCDLVLQPPRKYLKEYGNISLNINAHVCLVVSKHMDCIYLVAKSPDR